MIPGIIASAQMMGAGGAPPAFAPWDEIARQATIASGKLTITGLSLSEYIAIQVHWTGIRITTDDSELYLRYFTGGVEQSTLYRGTIYAGAENGTVASGGYGTPATTDRLTVSRQTAANKMGNATAESAGGEMIIFEPASLSLFKTGSWESSFILPDGTSQRIMGATVWEGTTAIDGLVMFGSSDLVDGELIVTGLK